MDMIELNLLPKELRKKKKRQVEQMPQIPMLPVALGVLGVLIVVHLVLLMLVRSNRRLSTTLAAKWEQMQPQRDKTDAIAKEINELQRRVRAVRKIAKPDLDWARLLEGLNQAVIPNVWLSEFRVTYDKRKRGKSGKKMPQSLDLTGYALGKSEVAMSTVGKFMESLKKAENFSVYFDEIELQNIRNAMIAGEEVMMFKLICNFEGREPVKDEEQKRGKRRRS